MQPLSGGSCASFAPEARTPWLSRAEERLYACRPALRATAALARVRAPRPLVCRVVVCDRNRTHPLTLSLVVCTVHPGRLLVAGTQTQHVTVIATVLGDLFATQQGHASPL